jgi:hypothetical protein
MKIGSRTQKAYRRLEMSEYEAALIALCRLGLRGAFLWLLRRHYLRVLNV